MVSLFSFIFPFFSFLNFWHSCPFSSGTSHMWNFWALTPFPHSMSPTRVFVEPQINKFLPNQFMFVRLSCHQTQISTCSFHMNRSWFWINLPKVDSLPSELWKRILTITSWLIIKLYPFWVTKLKTFLFIFQLEPNLNLFESAKIEFRSDSLIYWLNEHTS